MPRTQTSDGPGRRIGSNSFLLFAINQVHTNEELYLASGFSSVVVVTSMDLCNIGGSSGDSCALAVGPNNAGIFGGVIGAGAFDTFSWRGELALTNGLYLYVFFAQGQWSASATGHYEPEDVRF